MEKEILTIFVILWLKHRVTGIQTSDGHFIVITEGCAHTLYSFVTYCCLNAFNKYELVFSIYFKLFKTHGSCIHEFQILVS